MANNRLFAVCKKCNQYVTIAKYYPSGFLGGANGGYAPINNDSLEDFEIEHSHCGYDAIRFVTEDDERVERLDFDNKRIFFKKGVKNVKS